MGSDFFLDGTRFDHLTVETANRIGEHTCYRWKRAGFLGYKVVIWRDEEDPVIVLRFVSNEYASWFTARLNSAFHYGASSAIHTFRTGVQNIARKV